MPLRGLALHGLVSQRVHRSSIRSLRRAHTRLLSEAVTGRNSSWKESWRSAKEHGAASSGWLFKSLGAGVVGIGVLLVTWPVLDNIIAPVAVRVAMVAPPQEDGGLCGREVELEKLDALIEGTSPAIWLMDGVGKTSLLRMEQGRRPTAYINLRETASVNDLVYQLVTHLYQPLGKCGNLIVSYTQLVQASINILGATDGDVYKKYQELFFSLYLTHLRRALSATTSQGPIAPMQQGVQAVSSLVSQRWQQGRTDTGDDRKPLLVIDHADRAVALGAASSEEGYQRLLDELFLLAIAISQDTGAAQVVIATGTEGLAAVEKRVEGLGGRVRRLTVAGLSAGDSSLLVKSLVKMSGKAKTVSERDAKELEGRAMRECKGDPSLIQDMVAREVWGSGRSRKNARKLAVGIDGEQERGAPTEGGWSRHVKMSVAGAAVLVLVGLVRGG
eukprot:CAMPEP_0181303818 /NCGR_PEP_ID=MMETSP1101-20121128/8779_1 /TAXON_ID=46948 /ORGANISM="Rhodomonas abbreviata, Strain Caron Lab Isolate" /LENGTH=444 /DNA_ID=CAMNT_0023409453 /DNA_START=205 /DNA_END=1539 /DNA_ORIENTATION=-